MNTTSDAPIGEGTVVLLADGARSWLRARLRPHFYRAWRLLPSWVQYRLMRWGAAKVSFGACAVIRDPQGRVLMVHHTYRRVLPWGLPGGLGRGDEQPWQTVAREVREELGVDATIGPLLHAAIYEPSGHLTLYYQARIGAVPRLDGVETDSFRYATPAEVGHLLGTRDLPWLTAESSPDGVGAASTLRVVGR